jgi:alkylhydroperoxidase family enzyme
MARIRTITFEQATGALRRELQAAIERAGRIFNIVGVMSINAAVLKASMDFYVALMHRKSRLSRGRREMLAVVVSAANRCVY